MSTALELIDHVRAAGGSVWLARGRLRWWPSRSLPTEVLAALQLHKASIKALLAEFGDPVDLTLNPAPYEYLCDEEHESSGEYYGIAPVDAPEAPHAAAYAAESWQVPDASTSQLPPLPRGPCRRCRCFYLWRHLDQGAWGCGVCFPPTLPEEELEIVQVRRE